MQTTRASRPHAAILALAFTSAFAALLLAACKKSGEEAKPPDVEYYTCTMHPSVKFQDPKAKCPICSMDLVPVKKKPGEKGAQGDSSNLTRASTPAGDPAGGQAAKAKEARSGAALGETSKNTHKEGEEQPGEFTVPVERQQQIGVTYAKVEKQPFKQTIRVVGLVAYDQRRHWDYVSRVDGYVEKLFVFSPGETVETNAPLLAIFSPNLFTTENEFVGVLKSRDEALSKGDRGALESAQLLVDSTVRRLRLWNITAEQIAELERTRKPQETLTLHSPFKGIVQQLGVEQGRRVMVGDRLVGVTDLSVVWVWAQFYENELALLKRGLTVTIGVSAYPGEKFSGKISIIDPFINDASRTARVRIDVDNPGMKIHPGMYVDVALKLDMGEGLAVPVTAVLPTGLHTIVFVERGEGKLAPRFVELGGKYGDFYEVRSGLKENERVVTSANFLIDAEAKVQGALKSW